MIEKKATNTLLGVDYGASRIGVAFARGNAIAPIETINTKNENFAIQEIARYCVENKVEKVIIGLPLTLDGKETSTSKKVRQFGKKVRIYTKRPVEYQNEYGTSQDALATAIDMGVSKKSRRISDHLAAYLILKDYLDDSSTGS